MAPPLPPPKTKFMVGLQFWYYICWAPLRFIWNISSKFHLHQNWPHMIPWKQAASFFFPCEGGIERVHGHHPNPYVPNLRFEGEGGRGGGGFMHGFMPIGEHSSQKVLRVHYIWASLVCHSRDRLWSVRLLRCLSKYIFSIGPLLLFFLFVLSLPPMTIFVWQGFSM